MNKIVKSALLWAVILFSAFSTACKMDIKHEIWLKKNGSGKARMDFFINYPISAGNEGMQFSISEAFGGMVEELKTSKGYKLLSYKTIVDSTESEINYREVIEFQFTDLDKLNQVLRAEDMDAIRLSKEKKKSLLTLYPPGFKLLSYERQQENLSLFDIAAEIKLHLPAKPKSVKGDEPSGQKGKLLTWSWLLDENWYSDFYEDIVIEY